MMEYTYTVQSTEVRVHKMNDAVIDIKFFVTPQQRQELLRNITNPNVNKKTWCYTSLFQNSLTKMRSEPLNDSMETLVDDAHRLSTYFIPLESFINQQHPGYFFRYYDANKLQYHSNNDTWIDIDVDNPDIIFERMQLSVGTTDYGQTQVYLAPQHIEHFLPSTTCSALQKIDQIKIAHDLQLVICNLDNAVLKTLEIMRTRYDNNPAAMAIVVKLAHTLYAKSEAFRSTISHVINNPDANNIAYLTSIHDRDTGFTIDSLGTFMAEQLHAIAKANIDLSYTIHNNRALDLLHVNHCTALFSDIAAHIRAKAFSMESAEYNDTHSPIPLSMIDNLSKTHDTFVDQERKWLSISHLTPDFYPSDVDKIICILTEGLPEKLQKPSFAYSFRTFLAAIPELFLSVCRLPVSLALLITHAIERIFSDTPETWASKADKTLSEWHDTLSEQWLVTKYKKEWAAQYQRLDENDEPINSNNPHQTLLTENIDTRNYFQHFFADFFSVSHLANMITEWARTSWNYIKNIGHAWRQRFTDTSDEKTNVQELQEQQYLLKLLRKGLTSEDTSNTYMTPSPCQDNTIDTFLSVMSEIMHLLNFDCIDPMLRKSPLISSVIFTPSLLAFISYAPVFQGVAGLSPVLKVLQASPNFWSMSMTGQAAGNNVATAMIAAFLEWQMAVFPAELLMDIQAGRTEYLQRHFDQPEILSTALITLTITGISLGYLPLIPATFNVRGIGIRNLFADLINLFIEESQETRKGIFAFASMTDIILAIKFGAVMQSMLVVHENPHDVQYAYADALKTIVGACIREKITEAENPTDIFNAILERENIATKYGISDDSLSKMQNSIATSIEQGNATKESLHAAAENEAHSPLKQLLNLCSDPENAPLFLSQMQSTYNDTYNRLDTLIDEHNQTYSNHPIDKNKVLSTFYNCSETNNNLFHFFSIFPLYPVTLTYRGIKWVLSKVLNKPHWAHDVKKGFYKDQILLPQLASMFSGTIYTLTKAINLGILRPLAFLITCPAALCPAIYEKIVDDKEFFAGWARYTDRWTSAIALHRINCIASLRVFYADLAHHAGPHHDLQTACQQALMQIDAAENTSEVGQNGGTYSQFLSESEVNNIAKDAMPDENGYYSFKKLLSDNTNGHTGNNTPTYENEDRGSSLGTNDLTTLSR